MLRYDVIFIQLEEETAWTLGDQTKRLSAEHPGSYLTIGRPRVGADVLNVQVRELSKAARHISKSTFHLDCQVANRGWEVKLFMSTPSRCHSVPLTAFISTTPFIQQPAKSVRLHD